MDDIEWFSGCAERGSKSDKKRIAELEADNERLREDEQNAK